MKEINEKINKFTLEDKEKKLQEKSLEWEKQTKNYFNDENNLELKKLDLCFQNSNIKNISNVLNGFGNALKNIDQMRLNYENNVKKALEPLIIAQKHLTENFVQIQGTVKKIAESMAAFSSPELIKNLSKTAEYFSELSEAYVKAKKNPDSFLNWLNYSKKIREYFWTIPYDISSEELNELFMQVGSEKEFDKYMLKYFDRRKINKLCNEISLRVSRKHRMMFKQIKASFDSKNYALANVGMLSIIDELCSKFLYNKGKSRRIDIFLPLIEEVDNSSDVFEAIPIMILNENINIIYESIDFNSRITIKTNKKVRRNPSQHGQYFSNKKIDSLMLLNTIYNLLIISENYKQYLGKIIFVNNKKDLKMADTKYSDKLKRFYFRKKYLRKKFLNQI